MSRRWVIALVAGVVLIAAGVGAAALVVWHNRHPGTIRGSGSTEFETTAEPGATTRPEKVIRKVPWPTYGYDEQRSRYVPGIDLRPPYRKLWTVKAGSLLEFPPVVAYGHVYVGSNNGRFYAVESETGRIAWKTNLQRCIAASPTVGKRVVYQPLMDPHPCREHKQNAPGFMVAFDADTGDELWRFQAGVIESSPLVVGRLLYFGSWDGKVYALDVRTHKPVWTFATGDQVKGGPAYANGTLYFGSYDDKVYAVNARTGKLRWSASGTANFYATPTVAYGRVFVGNTDGRVYAFGADSGHLLWAKATGGFVYSSAAVWDRTVYVGSYSKRFYALDAGSGDVRWSFDAGAPISGAPTVLDGVVYFSTLDEKTFALDARNGKKLWRFDDGKYSPVVADRERIYLAGYKKLYGLAPESG
ncbi:MAG TPA: PQQ-binding-like beta-propeller repeat protein [Gaiellaceae bacterium]|nr:PQQ-binding-like beta-propeller repeat protein [Gaiellaceae bacterium]